MVPSGAGIAASATPIQPAAAPVMATAAAPIVPAFMATRRLRECGIPELLVPDRGPPPCRQARTLTTPAPFREGQHLKCSKTPQCPVRWRVGATFVGAVALVGSALAGCGGGSS